LYTEIEREKKLFRPLVIPKNLQKSLPYKDKPRFGPLNPSKPIERVAVIHSPHEQKVIFLFIFLFFFYANQLFIICRWLK